MSLFYGTILTIATFIWGWIFYKKEYHPEPLKVILQSFLGGLLAMLPIFGYKYVYLNLLPQLSAAGVLKPLWESALLTGLIFFFVNMFLIITLLTSMIGIVSLLLTFFKNDTLSNIQNALQDDKAEYVTMSSMIALLVYAERTMENFLNIEILMTSVGMIMFLAVIEEYTKHLMVRFIAEKKIKDVDDAITLSIVVGLAFSFIETIIYAINVKDMGLILPRALLSMPIHIIASGIFGYYYGLSCFAKPILKIDHTEKRYRIRFKWFHTVLNMRKSDVYEEEKIAQGLVMATVFHAGANALFEMNLAFITVPAIAVGLFFLSYFYKESHFIYRLMNKR